MYVAPSGNKMLLVTITTVVIIVRLKEEPLLPKRDQPGNPRRPNFGSTEVMFDGYFCTDQSAGGLITEKDNRRCSHDLSYQNHASFLA